MHSEFDQFERIMEVYHDKDRLTRDLELILDGTRGMAAATNKEDAAKCALKSLLRGSPERTDQSLNIWIGNPDDKSNPPNHVPRHILKEMMNQRGQPNFTAHFHVGGTIWIVSHISDAEIAICELKNVIQNENRLREERFFEALGQSLAAVLASLELRERERKTLRERVWMASEFSDKLNSPLMVALTTVDRLLKNFTHASDPEGHKRFISSWTQLSPHLVSSLATIKTESAKLAAFREGELEDEATKILQVTEQTKKSAKAI